MHGDVIAGADEELDGEPLLRPAMRGGEPTDPETLGQIRDRTALQLEALSEELRRPGGNTATTAYPVRYSDRLRELTAES
jgi:nicotinate phosphoribosyltransferase